MPIPNPATSEAAGYHDPAAFGYAAVRWQNTQERRYRLAELPQVLNAPTLPPDTFVQQSDLRTWRSRRFASVLRVGVSFVDCDTHKTEYADLRPDDVARALLMHCEDARVPRPSRIVFSGRGVHVKWLYDKPIPAAALARWQAVQEQIADRLKPFGADKGALDVTRCLRVVGSLNSRSGEVCRIVYDDGATWDFETLAGEVLPYSRQEVAIWKEAQEAKRARKTENAGMGRRSNWWPGRELWNRRLEDVRTLAETRYGPDGVPTGLRHNFLFVATCALAWSLRPKPETIEAEAQELARQLCPTLPLAEVRATVRGVVGLVQAGKPYRLRTQSIVNLLEIEADEQRSMQTLYDADERKRRKREYDARRQWGDVPRSVYLANAQVCSEEAQSLRAEGLTYSQIAEHMDRNLNTVKKWLRRKSETDASSAHQ